MFNFSLRHSLLLLLLFGVPDGYAQDHRAILDSLFGSSSSQFRYKVRDQFWDSSTEHHFYYVQQTDLSGIPVNNCISAVVIDSNNELTHLLKRWTNAQIQKSIKRKVEAFEFLHMAYQYAEIDKQLKSSSKAIGLGSGITPAFVDNESYYTSVYVEKDKLLYLNYLYTLYNTETEEWWEVALSSESGALSFKRSFTIHCDFGNNFCYDFVNNKTTQQYPFDQGNHESSCSESYRVYNYPLLNPKSGARSLVISPWNKALNASPLGWNDTIITRGNNVYAYEDRNDVNSIGYSPSGGVDQCFDFPLDLNSHPVSQQDAIITNLFYWNNLIHDVMYQYGFDDNTGNFQHINTTNIAGEGDRVFAEAQDGSGTNNANFSTFPDGVSPRMQMYLWNSKTSVTSLYPPVIAGIEYQGIDASFTVDTGVISGQLVAIDPIDACSEIQNANTIQNNIALIDRGDCFFTDKVLAAQTAGAIGVIICNTENSVFSMSGIPDSAVHIPAIMLKKQDCDTLKAYLESVIVSIEHNVPFDSDLDNGVITHEYAHGISIRLTGGASTSSCLSNQEQMGEGWSDWYALMFSLDPADSGPTPVGIGNYLLGQSESESGLRGFPYSTDMNINPMTYDWIKVSTVPHGVGSVWATVLWDLTWAFIDTYGFDDDFYYGAGGNNMALRLVTTALKLQPCEPGFLDGRDAIIAADELLFQGANKCLIWQVFARRGLGVSATQGSSNSRNDGLQAFDQPTECAVDFYFTKTGPSMAYVGDSIYYQINYRNNSTPVQNVIITDVIPDDLAYYLNSLQTTSGSGSYNDGLITFNFTSIDSTDDGIISYAAQVVAQDSSTVYYLQDWEDDIEGWTFTNYLGTDEWTIEKGQTRPGEFTFFVADRDSNQLQELRSPLLLLDTNVYLGLWHKFDLEPFYDGGFVEVSIDSGATWVDLASKMISNGYNGTLLESSNPFSAGRKAFTASSGGYQETLIDLTEYKGAAIQLRLVFASDLLLGVDGWHIDEVSLYVPYTVVNNGCIVSQNELIFCSEVETVILPRTLQHDCDNVNLIINHIDKNQYSAIQSLTSDAMIGKMQHIRFNSGLETVLSSNFEVAQMGTMGIYISNCQE